MLRQEQEGGSADLLGLGVPSAGNGVTSNGGTGPVTDNIIKFYFKNNGILYENDILQVSCDCDAWLR